MKPVPEYSTLRPGLFHWQGYEPEVKCDCTSTAIVTASGLIFIDPIPLADAPLKDLVAESFSAPAAVVLTSGNHQRESLTLAKRFGVPVFAPEGAGDDIIGHRNFTARLDFSRYFRPFVFAGAGRHFCSGAAGKISLAIARVQGSQRVAGRGVA